MEKIENLPIILKEIIDFIEEYVIELGGEIKKTLPVKVNVRGQNTTITWNIFPEFKKEIETIFFDIQRKFRKILGQISKGELLEYEITRGKILDAGLEGFSIKKGILWDLYFYEEELLIYIRLLHETVIDKPKDEWISIDIDLVEQSAWFVN